MRIRHCGARHNADLNLSGTEIRCASRLWVNSIHKLFSLEKLTIITYHKS